MLVQDRDLGMITKDDLKIVTVVVHRFPNTIDPALDISVRFESLGDGQWSIAGDQ